MKPSLLGFINRSARAQSPIFSPILVGWDTWQLVIYSHTIYRKYNVVCYHVNITVALRVRTPQHFRKPNGFWKTQCYFTLKNIWASGPPCHMLTCFKCQVKMRVTSSALQMICHEQKYWTDWGNTEISLKVTLMGTWMSVPNATTIHSVGVETSNSKPCMSTSWKSQRTTKVTMYK